MGMGGGKGKKRGGFPGMGGLGGGGMPDMSELEALMGGQNTGGFDPPR
jgi:hypothetical protein